MLISGNHALIEKWRREEAERLTRERRAGFAEVRGGISELGLFLSRNRQGLALANDLSKSVPGHLQAEGIPGVGAQRPGYLKASGRKFP